jgi:hypothetical protein
VAIEIVLLHVGAVAVVVVDNLLVVVLMQGLWKYDCVVV